MSLRFTQVKVWKSRLLLQKWDGIPVQSSGYESTFKEHSLAIKEHRQLRYVMSFWADWVERQDSLAAAVVKHLSLMAATQLIAARVTSETKAHFRALAERQQLTESVLLKRMIDLTLQSVSAAGGETLEPVDRVARGARLCIRLRSEDQLLLRERASARQMATATYVSVLIRAHLRALPPLPKDELSALKRSVAELGAIGRNLNQIARTANQGGRVSGPGREDLRAMLKVCEGLRDHVKALIKANEASWENGHAKTND